MTTRTTACEPTTGDRARAGELRTALLDHGVKAVSIELVERRSGSGWLDNRLVGTMGHHIVSHRGQGLTPALRLVKVGRSDLPALCNGYGGFDEVARIICMAWANHPGQVAPHTVEKGTVPANNGRPYFFGWEFEGGIRESDWTDSFRTFMGRCYAATLAWLGATEHSHIEHKTWAPGRKIDRLNYTLARARAEITPHFNSKEDDMLTIGPHSSTEDKRLVQGMLIDGFGANVTETGNWEAATQAALAKHVGHATGDARAARGEYVNNRTFRELLHAVIAKKAPGGGAHTHRITVTLT